MNRMHSNVNGRVFLGTEIFECAQCIQTSDLGTQNTNFRKKIFLFVWFDTTGGVAPNRDTGTTESTAFFEGSNRMEQWKEAIEGNIVFKFRSGCLFFLPFDSRLDIQIVGSVVPHVRADCIAPKRTSYFVKPIRTLLTV